MFSDLSNIRLPQFVHVVPTVAGSGEELSRRIKSCRRLVKHLELESVVAGLRPCALLALSHSEVDDIRLNLKVHGLEAADLLPLSGQAGYQNGASAIGPGGTNGFFAIGARGEVKELASAYMNDRHTVVAEMLGYPSCCSEFFDVVWRQEGLVDTSWPMAINTKSVEMKDDRNAVVALAGECNIFLKSVGVRHVFHLPCSSDCAQTRMVATRLRDLACSQGTERGDEMRCLTDMLLQPLRWTAHYGVAEIALDDYTVFTTTDFYRDLCSINAIPSPGGDPEI